MTIFLCILALVALFEWPTVKGTAGMVVGVTACWTVLVLGITMLALICYWASIN